MKPILTLNLTVAVAGLLVETLTASAAEPTFQSWAKTPPMGWNSWDCYGAGVRESNAIANADYMAQLLKPHGWDIITLDIQWYEPLAQTTAYRRGAVLELDAAATQPGGVSVSLADIGFSGPVKVGDLWNHKDPGASTGAFAPEINSHGAGFFRVQAQI